MSEKSDTTDGASIPDQTDSGDPWHDDTERARYFDAENKRASDPAAPSGASPMSACSWCSADYDALAGRLRGAGWAVTAPRQEIVSVPRDVAERVMEIIEFYDDLGPPGEGWQSEGLRKTIDALRDSLKSGTS